MTLCLREPRALTSLGRQLMIADRVWGSCTKPSSPALGGTGVCVCVCVCVCGVMSGVCNSEGEFNKYTLSVNLI